MARFVRERMRGGYADLPGDQHHPDCTHVLLTKAEYTALLQERESAAQEQRRMQYETGERIRHAQQEAEYRAAAAEKAAEEKIRQIEQALEAEQRESAYQRGLNANLLRIARERANADRHLRPKKAQTGYVVVSSTEKEQRYREDGMTRAVRLWETVLQSPYGVDFTEEQARYQMQELFRKSEAGGWLICRIGINACWEGGYAELMREENVQQLLQERNILVERRLRANYRAGYWEMICLHTKPLGVVPQEMRAR